MKFGYMKKEEFEPSPVGSPYKDDNVLKRDGNNLILEKVGQINQQEVIESYADSVDLGKMIERFRRSGDQSILDRRRGEYFDASGMPTDLREHIHMVRDAAAQMQQSAQSMNDQSAASEQDPAAAQSVAAAPDQQNTQSEENSNE